MVSEISSLDDDGDVDLLNPASRKFRNDKEYLKYVNIQMWWNFLTKGFCGLYACFLATLALIPDMPYLNIECENGRQDYTVWEAAEPFTDIFLAMHPIIVIMSATFDYFIYFSIPYRLNRIKKTDKELMHEAEARIKALREKTEGRDPVKVCGVVIIPGKKKKKNKKSRG